MNKNNRPSVMTTMMMIPDLEDSMSSFPLSTEQMIDYVSPIASILEDLRRRKLGSAIFPALFAVATHLPSSDPWGNAEDATDYYSTTQQQLHWLSQCASCGGSSTSTSTSTRFSSPGKLRSVSSMWRSPPNDNDNNLSRRRNILGVCPQCGNQRPAGTNLFGNQSFIHCNPNEIHLTHADALLQSTPHLRFILPTRHFWLKSHFDYEAKTSSKGGSDLGGLSEYRQSLLREQADALAASELASSMWILAHEMSLEEYGVLESEIFTQIFALIHDDTSSVHRMAGLAALDAVLSAPSADEERKAIKFANTLSNSLRGNSDFAFLHKVSQALGHMAIRTANVDFVESEVTRALEWLRNARSDRRLAACLCLKEFATNLPTTFHSKTNASNSFGSNEFLDHIGFAIRDPQPIVRACAADALSQCLKILVERHRPSLTGLLCQVYDSILDGLKKNSQNKPNKLRGFPLFGNVSSSIVDEELEATQHGSLLAVSSLILYTRDFVLPRFEEICRAVLAFTDLSSPLIRLEVVRLIPKLAKRCPRVFGRRYLDLSLSFLMDNAALPPVPRLGIDVRPSAFSALGQLLISMTDESTGQVIGGSPLPTLRFLDDNEGGQIVEMCPDGGIIYQKLEDIVSLVRTKGLANERTVRPALFTAASLVETLGDTAVPYIPGLIDDMFKSGLSHDLIRCLQAIADCVPAQQTIIEDRILQGVSMCLAGRQDVHNSLAAFTGETCLWPPLPLDTATSMTDTSENVTINMACDSRSVRSLVLGLQTLASFGGGAGASPRNMALLLPFVRDVVARYLLHPSPDVRQAAALTCCVLLVVPSLSQNHHKIGSYSGMIVEDVLQKLVRFAVSDPSPAVRLSVIQALDFRYDTFLCQYHHLQDLFLLLEDEALTTRAAGLRLLGRLAAINPGPILPVMRKLLHALIVELQCGVDAGRVREEATRLLVVFLRAKPLQRLIHPILPILVSALPLDGSAPPRLASASLEALGELAQATGKALQPWVKDIIPHVLEIMRDRSSASKQRTSLRTLGQIAGSTGYVIQPYLDYPKLLAQATDILPATKRAPWSLRREVIRTLGIVGALDPDRYHEVASKARKGGAVGGAYFEVDLNEGLKSSFTYESSSKVALSKSIAKSVSRLSILPSQTDPPESAKRKSLPNDQQIFQKTGKDADDENEPAYLFMYEQYAMVAQPVSTVPPAKRMTPSSEGFYPTVAIQALMRIFRDQSLAVHHGQVVQAVMFIFKSLGMQCVPYLDKVVPSMVFAVKTCGPSNLREALLKDLATLSSIVREHLRKYFADIFGVVEEFWASRHLATIFSLLSNLAVGCPDEFRRFAPRVIQLLLGTFDELQLAEWSTGDVFGRSKADSDKLRLILNSICNLKGVLGEYLRLLIPALLKLGDSLATVSMRENDDIHGPMLEELSVMVYWTVSTLLESLKSSHSSASLVYYPEEKFICKSMSETALPARVVQPLVRIFREKPPRSLSVGLSIIETLCVCVRLIGTSKWIQLYDAVVRDAITTWQSTLPLVSGNELPPCSIRFENRVISCLALYDELIDELHEPPSDQSLVRLSRRGYSFMGREGFPMGSEGFIPFGGAVDIFEQNISPAGLQPGASASTRQKINQSKLQRAWDVSQRTSRDDWDEWMRRFSIQLLREAPSPALRATASLAQAYQPLARELFCAAFACCWKELNDAYRQNLVDALKTAFVADVSPEILQALLNLGEFMEHDPGGGLPIEIPVLADLALKCRAYAKALHYKEREYTMGASNSCVEALISINGKLDLPEAALGILKASSYWEQHRNLYESNNNTSHFSRHQACDMYYSVIWNTEDRLSSVEISTDLSSQEESWLAKLGAWSEALGVYENKLLRDPNDFEAIVGCMRCHIANGEWRRVLELAENNWLHDRDNENAESMNKKNEEAVKAKRKAKRMCAQAAWRLGQWGDLEKYASQLANGGNHLPSSSAQSPGMNDSPRINLDFDGAFYSAVLHIHRNDWSNAAEAIDAARKAMDSRLTALMAESYSRAYSSMVTAQTLAEMEEIVELRKIEGLARAGEFRHPLNRPNDTDARKNLLSVWRKRLAGCRVDAEVHASILAVRSLILGPTDEVDSTLRLSDLSRQSQRPKFAERILLDPLEALNANLKGPCFGFGVSEQLRLRVDFSSLTGSAFSAVIDRILQGEMSQIIPYYGQKHEQWSRSLVNEAGGLDRLIIQYRLYFAYVRHLWYTDHRDEAIYRLSYLSEVVDMVCNCENVSETSLRVSCLVELGAWKIWRTALPGSNMYALPDPLKAEVLTLFKRATTMENCGYRAWHAWSLLNFRIALLQGENIDRSNDDDYRRSTQTLRILRNHVVVAVRGFVNAISCGTKKWCASVQQDLVNLLTCLFKYGHVMDIASVINESIVSVTNEAWLGVLPQLLARIHIKDPSIRSVLHPLLTRLGEKHPQALMYPLSVLLKSPVSERKNAAESLMNSLKKHSSELVEEALMVSSELIRVAILWLEIWHDGLEDASRTYFADGNVNGMIDLLLPLHEELEKGAETRRESEFIASFGQDLERAHLHVKDYVRLSKENSTDEAEAAINKAWDIYYTVFRRINKQLPSLTKLELPHCSPALNRARSLELGVPGSYRVDGSYVNIEKFIPHVEVITSKQRPRKVTVRGSDGKDYVFLLKGHEDLRQDERVMQLFGLVNALLERDPQTRKHDLKIQRYAICPLSHDAGIVGWVPNTDTLHSVIRDYRQSKKIPLNMENLEMLKIAPDYDLLTVMQKVEVFVEALKKTTGQGNDLYEILWLKSTNSEEWLERRTRYARSLAVMSMVGYILGLGDRHPSNLMLDKLTGRVLHIDLGDCFEVAMNREKFPEKVPFRLTRMLIRAMEVSGIEGSYRSTCERTLNVLRDSKDSLVAMLEAFVYDPLISWRLADISESNLSGDRLRERPVNNPFAPVERHVDGVPIEVAGRNNVYVNPISEGREEDEDDAEDDRDEILNDANDEELLASAPSHRPTARDLAASRARSLQMHSEIQALAANVNMDARIASIAGDRSDRILAGVVEGSQARSRMERSMRQREYMSTLGGEEGAAREETLNQKALKVIRRVEDKLTGTDFSDCDDKPLDVADQVQRLIVQATSIENLCQLYIGWCSFW